jgi:SAM-dependent methyltransferase
MKCEDWDQRYAEQAQSWSVEPNQFVVAETADLKPGRALDLAAGEGRNAVWLAEQGWRVTAVDFSTVGIDKGRRLAAQRGVEVDWVVADLLHYRPEPLGWELVLLCYLQISKREREQVLARARQALAPGGTLLYIAHDLSNLEHGVGGPKHPEVLCTPADVVADLPGLQILKAEVVKRSVAREPGHDGPARAIALDTLVRAVR